MMTTRFLSTIVALACGAIVLPVAAQTPVGTSLTFQGQLNENGQPGSAEYDFQFRLFDAASGGTAISQMLAVGDVPVENGLFSRELDFVPMPNETLFDGDNRWIEVYVRPGNSNGAYTTLTPRQKLTAAPYAVYALEGPGGSGPWSSRGPNIYNTNAGNVGIRTSTPLALLDINGEGVSSAGLRLYHPGSSTGLMEFGGPTGSPGIATFANSGNRRDIRFTDLGMFLLTSNTPERPGATSGIFIGETGLVGIGTYEPTARLDVYTESAGSRDNTARFYAPNIGPYVSHVHYGTTGNWYIRSASSAGKVVLQDGGGSVGIGTTTNAGKVTISTPDNTALYVSALGDAGPVANFTSGLNSEFGGNVINVVTVGDSSSRAIYALQTGAGGVGAGKCGVFEIANPDSSAWAVEGLTSGTGVGVLGHTTGDGNAGYFVNRSTDNPKTALYCRTDGTGLAFHAAGIARVEVLEITGADIAEKFPVAAPECAAPGTVMEIDPDRPGHLRVASTPYSPGVAGVVSGANDLSVGTVLGNLPGHEDAPPIALTGRVWVLCDASSGPIEPNDLLTTSDTPGHAMKAADRDRAYGASIGKAMSSLKEGKGLVLVLVSLQ